MKKANKTDKQTVIDILVSAFAPLHQDNSINFVIKQDKNRIGRMQVLMSYLFERALLFGEVFLSDNEQACLLINYPHKEKTTLRTIWLDLNLAFRCIGVERVFKVLKRQRIAKRNYPKEKHIRPMIAGIKNEHKGSGTAARLMLEVMAYHKQNQLPVLIDAASKENAKLYQKLGFKIISKEELLGFPIYFLRLN